MGETAAAASPPGGCCTHRQIYAMSNCFQTTIDVTRRGREQYSCFVTKTVDYYPDNGPDGLDSETHLAYA